MTLPTLHFVVEVARSLPLRCRPSESPRSPSVAFAGPYSALSANGSYCVSKSPRRQPGKTRIVPFPLRPSWMMLVLVTYLTASLSGGARSQRLLTSLRRTSQPVLLTPTNSCKLYAVDEATTSAGQSRAACLRANPEERVSGLVMKSRAGGRSGLRAPAPMPSGAHPPTAALGENLPRAVRRLHDTAVRARRVAP